MTTKCRKVLMKKSSRSVAEKSYLRQQRVEMVVVDDSHTAARGLISDRGACRDHAHLDDEKTPELSGLDTPPTHQPTSQSPVKSSPLLVSFPRSRCRSLHRITRHGGIHNLLSQVNTFLGFPWTSGAVRLKTSEPWPQSISNSQ